MTSKTSIRNEKYINHGGYIIIYISNVFICFELGSFLYFINKLPKRDLWYGHDIGDYVRDRDRDHDIDHDIDRDGFCLIFGRSDLFDYFSASLDILFELIDFIRYHLGFIGQFMPKIGIYLKNNFDGYRKIGTNFKNQKSAFKQWIQEKTFYRIVGASVC